MRKWLINSSLCKKVADFKQLCFKQPCLICFLRAIFSEVLYLPQCNPPQEILDGERTDHDTSS